MEKMTRIFMTVMLMLAISSSAVLAGNWSSTSMSILNGSGYELASSEDATILTLEHASGWAYGDNFLFFDVFQPFEDDTGIYGEWHPRFSFGKISKSDLSFGPVKDVLLATELNFGCGNRAYLYGLGLDLDIPHFSFFAVNFFIRDDPTIVDETTFQISPSWNIPFTLGETKWTLGGFLDYAGAEGDNQEAHLLFVPQLLLDVSNFADAPGNLFVGVEYQSWTNKYGVDAVEESVFQFMAKWFF
ncbi:MAG: hypothetical protein KOO60_11210 [Gemmatimonadales bacterium]|nr:hypothetical protein [Gemmatimonadales bacterium]